MNQPQTPLKVRPSMKELPWILVTGLFRELESHLIRLLRELSPDDWNRPTVCSQWSVKDIASHLLDGSLRRLSIQRDFYLAPEALKVSDPTMRS